MLVWWCSCVWVRDDGVIGMWRGMNGRSFVLVFFWVIFLHSFFWFLILVLLEVGT